MLRSGVDLGNVRDAVRGRTLALGLGELRRTHAVTAASELARNVIVHGGGGEVFLDVVGGPRGPGLRMVFSDRGPGISDLAQAMKPGWSSGGGLGLGLPGAQRLVDVLVVEAGPGGVGTRIEAIMWA